ncbi:MAG: hypothetical protein WBB98_17400 [Xanthobacteraceae bacterium]
MIEGVLDRLRDIVLFVAGILAISALIMAAYEGFNQRIASALFLGTLGVTCTFMTFMPKIEVFKVWGMEAKLQQTVTEAVATLASLRRLSAISARASYLTIAWGNRMGTPPAKVRQAVLDDIDSQLADLKIAPAEREVIVRPWTQMIRVDFFFVFTRVVREFATLKASDLTAKIHATQNQEDHDASNRHSELITPWFKQNENIKPLERLEADSLSVVLDEYMPKSGEWLSDRELATIEVFKREIIRLSDDCDRKGGYTGEAAEYYDSLSEHQAEKAKELWAASRS